MKAYGKFGINYVLLAMFMPQQDRNLNIWKRKFLSKIHTSVGPFLFCIVTINNPSQRSTFKQQPDHAGLESEIYK